MKTAMIARCVGLGTLFWFSAALIVRVAGEAVFTENNPLLVLFYALTFPITYLFLLTTRLVTSLPYSALLRPIVIITLTAAALDAIALSWFRWLYSESFEVALHGAALILWGVSVGLLFAFVLDWRGQRATSGSVRNTTAVL